MKSIKMVKIWLFQWLNVTTPISIVWPNINNLDSCNFLHWRGFKLFLLCDSAYLQATKFSFFSNLIDKIHRFDWLAGFLYNEIYNTFTIIFFNQQINIIDKFNEKSKLFLLVSAIMDFFDWITLYFVFLSFVFSKSRRNDFRRER